MSWTERKHSKGAIDRAGIALITLPQGHSERSKALSVIDNWRSCHAYPLHIVANTLQSRAKRIKASAIVSRRTKRMPSIALKLKQNPNMKLSQMQDIGGCRVVLPNLKDVGALIEEYRSTNKSRKNRTYWIEEYDYISKPKTDGYRGYHFVMSYDTDYETKKAFRRQRIEVQMRSKLQHAWATALETAELFTNQALKSKIKNASQNWLRFFQLMGSAIALRENRPLVPDTPTKQKTLASELNQLIRKEKIIQLLQGWNLTVNFLEKTIEEADIYLLLQSTNEMSLRIQPFFNNQRAEAEKEYLSTEKQYESEEHIQVVLVSVESIGALRRAYPNYFVDTKTFIEAVNKAIA